MILAHHVEAQHVPVLLAIGAAGFWIGWNLVSRILQRLAKRVPTNE
jgi:hypothetical protein